MTDEKYTFVADVRDKKRTATGAHHKRTHCGKGGAVKFPSDFMTKKERDAMNGEVKSYRLNDPMSWAEFKAMPDDIKVVYITALRKKYNVSDTKIAEMMRVSQYTLSNLMVRLGIRSDRQSREKWDKDGWYAWVNGVPLEAEEEVVETARETNESVAEFREEQEHLAEEVEHKMAAGQEKCDCTVERATPICGHMELEGTVAECAETLRLLLSGNRVKLSVSWTVT